MQKRNRQQLAKLLSLLAMILWLGPPVLAQEHAFQLNIDRIGKALDRAPLKGRIAEPVYIELPSPNGNDLTFEVTESPVIDAKVAQRLQMRTYAVSANDGGRTIGRLSYSPSGLYGVFNDGQQLYFISQDQSGEKQYRSFYDTNPTPDQYCRLQQLAENTMPAMDKPLKPGSMLDVARQKTIGGVLRTYDLVVAGTEEYTAFFPDQTAAETNMVNIVNAFNLIFQSEMAISLNLVDYTALTSDTYDADSGDADLAGVIINDVFPNTAGYDLGQVFHKLPDDAGGSGEATLGAVCTANKGEGWSSEDNPIATNAGWILLAVHEIGHQFNASHTFDGTAGACDQRDATSAFEPLSGSTIMGYFGVCDDQDVSYPGLSVFHVHSLQQMNNFVTSGTGNSCVASTNISNNAPVANANPESSNALTIPKSTPFRLTGQGTDPDGDVLAYSWEQYDLASSPPLTTDEVPRAGDATAPLFRSYFPSVSPTRTFPNRASLLANSYLNKDEALPTVGRTLNFRLTVRDNQVSGGGVDWSSLALTVDTDSGPFTVSSPDGGETWGAGSTVSVSWDPSSTASYCSTVDIRLSLDGGLTFPILLAGGTNNDGTEMINLAANVPNTGAARIEIACANDSPVVFFDISDEDFTINSSSCLADGGLICPSFPMTLPLGDAQLNFDLEHFSGSPLSVRDIAVTSADPDTDDNVVSDGTGTGGCAVVGAGEDFKDLFIRVDQNGDYGFNLGDLNYMTLFDNATYDSGNQCASFLGSTIGPGTNVLSSNNIIRATLEACKTYRLRIYGMGNYTLSAFGFSGGAVYLLGDGLPAGYSYTYAAVGQGDQQIDAVDAGADFTGLGAGSYQIVGLSYQNGLDPNDFIDQTVDQINAIQCVSVSKNAKLLTVVGTNTCELSSIGLTNVQCNDNSTVDNDADDYISFSLQPTGSNLGGGYNLSISSGTVTKTNGDPATNVPYGVATAFRLQDGSAGAGNVELTVTDIGSAGCNTNGALTDPGTCSPGGGGCVSNIFTSTDVDNKIIIGGVTVSSEIVIAEGGQIKDVNVLNLNGTHLWISDIIVTLRSPAGTEVTLFSEICGDEDDFDLNLDDEAATIINICPPTGGGTFQPLGDLSDFDNEDQAGTWTLTIEDGFDEDDGQLLGWQLEICSVSGSGGDCPETLPVNGTIAADTYRAKNITSSGMILSDVSVSFLAEESITLTNGFKAVPGSTGSFSARIEPCPAPGLVAEDPAVDELRDPRSRWALLQEGNTADISLSVRPNPSNGRTFIEYRLEESKPVSMEVFSLTGQRLRVLLPNTEQMAGNHQLSYDPTDLPAGIYLLVVQVEGRRLVKRLSRL